MPDREKVIKGLYDIGGFIAGRIGIEQARNFMRTIDDTIALLKEQEADMIALKNAYKELAEKGSVIVRCKDCKYGNWWSDENVIVCDKLSKTRNKNWFCADGVNKDA